MRQRFIAVVPLAAALIAAPAGADRAIVLSTDFLTGYYSSLELAPPWMHADDLGGVCPDAAVRVHGDRVYVLGRYGCDHIQVLDAATLATLDQYSTGNGTNPQDIEVVAPDKAYVSLYETDALLILDPRDGTSLGSVSLAAFSDADGLPEATDMAVVGDKLFVCLQRLDRPGGFTAANPSWLAVIDVATNTVVDVDPGTPGLQAIELSARNPFTELVLDPVRDKLYVGMAGAFGVLDGGVEFIDPVTLQAEGLFVTEAQLGGDLNAVRLWVDCSGYAVVNDASFRTRLVRFDRCNGGPVTTCHESQGFDLCDLDLDRQGIVLVADRDLLQPGVRLFHANDGSPVLPQPISVGLPPCELAPLAAPLPTPATPPGAAALHLEPNRPEPFNPTTTLRVSAPPGTAVRLDILDVRGRRVRSLWAGVLAGGERSLTWDGRDDAGVPAPSGVYVARLGSSLGTRRDKLTLVR
jgi:hypothetical protein